MGENIECGDFIFLNNFDSANLAKVEKVDINKADNGKNENNKIHKSSSSEFLSYEFNIWTKHDCHGTEFQNNNKTWFYFGIKAGVLGVYVKLNLVNLNKQVKMFSQGMCPVFKVIPGHPQWERIKEKPTFTADDKNNEFILSFNYRTSENPNAVTYFAFTYPFSYTDLQNYLKKLDVKMAKQSSNLADDIYYHRECAIKSLEERRLDILTISSYYNILTEREAKIKDLFPEENEERPFKFQNKKIIFLSARVHPGETPSSFVLNGFINLLLNKEDQIAIVLRRLYVFKLIPMLNPDGVAQGYYRMDTRGINLNRLYLNPSKSDHPTIFAAKTLIRYYHNSYTLPEDYVPEIANKNSRCLFDTTHSIDSISNETNRLLQRVTLMTLEEKNKCIEQGSRFRNCLMQASEKSIFTDQEYLESQPTSIETAKNIASRLHSSDGIRSSSQSLEDSGIFLYIDFHGHASKKGIFMYGNHFDDPDDSAACMLLPKLMSLNNPNFHFTSCNFAEKNMYLIDKRDGMSREGSGRVAVYKLTGLVYSYTLECNYNTGRLVNTVPARVKEGIHKIQGQLFVPPKYNPTVFEEVGAALGPSILDMTGNNPNSRLPNSQYRSLKGLKSYLKLISTNHYQTSLSKPLHKNYGSEQFRYSRDSSSIVNKSLKLSATSTITSTTKNNFNLINNSCKIFCTANVYGTMKKMKNNKRTHQIIDQSIQKSSSGNKTNNRESKVTVSKIISTQVQLKCKVINSNNKKIDIKMNFPVKNQASNKLKANDKNLKNKLSMNSVKKSSFYMKKGTIKKQGSQRLKSKVRHKFQIEFNESSKKKVSKVLFTSPNNKHKHRSNFIIKSKKVGQSEKLDQESSKKSSITLV